MLVISVTIFYGSLINLVPHGTNCSVFIIVCTWPRSSCVHLKLAECGCSKAQLNYPDAEDVTAPATDPSTGNLYACSQLSLLVSC